MSALWQRLEGPVGELRYYVTAGDDDAPAPRTLLVCHELPHSRGAAANVGATYPELADRLAEESGWRVSAATLRGAGSPRASSRRRAGWRRVLRLRHAIGPDERRAGSSGSASVGSWPCDWRPRTPACAGWACLGTPADLSGAITDPTRMLAVCRRKRGGAPGAVGRGLASWSSQLADLDPLGAAASLGTVACCSSTAPTTTRSRRRQRGPSPCGARPGRAPASSRPPGTGWRDPRVLASLIGWLERQH